MPSCARFTQDGVNEIEGLEPDVPLSIRQGSRSKRLEALQAAVAGPG
jgi:hypothetical protein